VPTAGRAGPRSVTGSGGGRRTAGRGRARRARLWACELCGRLLLRRRGQPGLLRLQQLVRLGLLRGQLRPLLLLRGSHRPAWLPARRAGCSRRPEPSVARRSARPQPLMRRRRAAATGAALPGSTPHLRLLLQRRLVLAALARLGPLAVLRGLALLRARLVLALGLALGSGLHGLQRARRRSDCLRADRWKRPRRCPFGF